MRRPDGNYTVSGYPSHKYRYCKLINMYLYIYNYIYRAGRWSVNRLGFNSQTLYFTWQTWGANQPSRSGAPTSNSGSCSKTEVSLAGSSERWRYVVPKMITIHTYMNSSLEAQPTPSVALRVVLMTEQTKADNSWSSWASWTWTQLSHWALGTRGGGGDLVSSSLGSHSNGNDPV